MKILLLALLLVGCGGPYKPYCHFKAGEVIKLSSGENVLVKKTGQNLQGHPSCLVYIIHSPSGRQWDSMTNETVLLLLHESDPRSKVIPAQIWK